MIFRYAWIVLVLVLGYGLLPVTLSDYSNNFNNPNILLIERQECGCPCAEGFIKKGHLKFSDEIKKQFPTLSEVNNQITLIDFQPFDDITNKKSETLSFANENSFKVSGQTIGVDTILCEPTNCEIVPKFKVNDWALTTYYPRFWKFSSPTILIYFGLCLFAFPILTIASFIRWRRQVKLKEAEK